MLDEQLLYLLGHFGTKIRFLLLQISDRAHLISPGESPIPIAGCQFHFRHQD